MPGSCGRSGLVSGNAFQTCHRPHEHSCRGRRLSYTIPSMSNDDSRTLARRSFFCKLGFGLMGGAAIGAAVPVEAQAPGRFDPARHTQDDWLDQIPGSHRSIVDAPNPDGFSSAIQFTTTYFNINVNDYGLKDTDLAVVLVARHLSTLFAYSDAIWAKYGKPISERNKVLDPKTNQPPTLNLQRERLEPLIKAGFFVGECGAFVGCDRCDGC